MFDDAAEVRAARRGGGGAVRLQHADAPAQVLGELARGVADVSFADLQDPDGLFVGRRIPRINFEKNRAVSGVIPDGIRKPPVEEMISTARLVHS
ncbi:hypothetical protein [Longimicrobium sp.]|uniref:hypothetical protein n=1 Tax=Longimicrobium sp. TaxID=2029185 RepID=UPI003B3A4832